MSGGQKAAFGISNHTEDKWDAKFSQLFVISVDAEQC